MMLRYDDGLPIAIISDVPLLRWGIFRFFRVWVLIVDAPIAIISDVPLLRWGIFRFFRVGVFTVGIHLVTYLL